MHIELEQLFKAFKEWRNKIGLEFRWNDCIKETVSAAERSCPAKTTKFRMFDNK
jgi:hypothetical protein